MERRQAIRFASLFAFATALGKFDALAQGSGKKDDPLGYLSVDLNQWDHVRFKYGKKVLAIPVAEIFAALEEGPHAVTR